MTAFVPGIDRNHAFYDDVVRVIVDPVPHAAALLGEGSDVLGYDTERSTDHAWGLRVQILVAADEVERVRAELDRLLPDDYDGLPVRYFRWQTSRTEHHVTVETLDDWLTRTLGTDPRPSMSTSAWLATPHQSLLEVTAGAVYRDDPGELTTVRRLLAWYPDNVWLWLIGCQWALIAGGEPLVGRAAEVGDDLGSRIITSRLAHDVMRLCFLQERRYAPYAKWLGTAFGTLDAAAAVAPALEAALTVPDYPSRAAALNKALTEVANRHNALGLTEPVEVSVSDFDVRVAGARRPFPVLNTTRFAEACDHALGDNRLRRLGQVGAIDQLMQVTDELVHFTDWPQRLRAVYDARLA